MQITYQMTQMTKCLQNINTESVSRLVSRHKIQLTSV